MDGRQVSQDDRNIIASVYVVNYRRLVLGVSYQALIVADLRSPAVTPVVEDFPRSTSRF